MSKLELNFKKMGFHGKNIIHYTIYRE